MQIVSVGDNLHEMSNPVCFFFVLEKLEKKMKLSSAEIARRVVKGNPSTHVSEIDFYLCIWTNSSLQIGVSVKNQ